MGPLVMQLVQAFKAVGQEVELGCQADQIPVGLHHLARVVVAAEDQKTLPTTF
jgi:hypothetical protein